MGELRDLFEDGMGGFRPSADEALERTRLRAERRARNRRLIAGSVALALAGTTLSGLWAVFRTGPESPRPAGPGPMGDPVLVRMLPDVPGIPLVSTNGYLWVAGSDLMRLDLATGRKETLIEDGSFLSDPRLSKASAALASGSVWIADIDLKVVYRLDAATGSLLASIDLEGGSPDSFVPGLIYPYQRSVRVTDAGSGATIDIDPRTDRIVATSVPEDGSAAPLFERSDEGNLWTVTDEDVQFLPAEGGPLAFQRWAFPGTPIDLALGDGTAWVAVSNAATGLHIYRLEPGSREATDISYPGSFDTMTYLDRRLWVIGHAPGDGCDASVRALDPVTGEQIGETLLVRTANSGPETGGTYAGCTAIGTFFHLLASGGHLWLQGSRDGLLQIDPNGDASRQPVPGADPDACPAPVLDTGYVPPGVEPRGAQPGVGGGADPNGEIANAIHFGDSPGPDGLPAPFINITRTVSTGGPRIQASHAEDVGTLIEVLGGTGYLLPIHEGWGVWRSYGHGRCTGCEITAYGLSKAETRRFAEGLRLFGALTP